MSDQTESEEELVKRRLQSLKEPKPQQRSLKVYAIPAGALVSGVVIGVWLSVGGAGEKPAAPTPETSSTAEFQSEDGLAGFNMTRPRPEPAAAPEPQVREVEAETGPDPALAELAGQIEALQAEIKSGKEDTERLGTDLDRALAEVADRDAKLLQAEAEKADLIAQFGSQPQPELIDSGEAEREAQRLAELEARRQAEAERREARLKSPAVAYRFGSGGGGGEGATASGDGMSPGDMAALAGGRELSTQEKADAFLRAGASSAQITRAQVIANPSNTIAQGTQLEASLVTAISSDLPGPVVAVVSRDVWSMDMAQVLIPRGSKLYGRYSADVEQGQRRVLIAWDRVITTNGQSAQLEAYGTDRIGRSGMTGKVNNHTLSRFGAAAAVSIIGALPSLLAAGIEEDRNGGVRDSTYSNVGQSVTEPLSEAMSGPLNRAPTISVHQGAVVMVWINADLEIW